VKLLALVIVSISAAAYLVRRQQRHDRAA